MILSQIASQYAGVFMTPCLYNISIAPGAVSAGLIALSMRRFTSSAIYGSNPPRYAPGQVVFANISWRVRFPAAVPVYISRSIPLRLQISAHSSIVAARALSLMSQLPPTALFETSIVTAWLSFAALDEHHDRSRSSTYRPIRPSLPMP